MEVAYPIAVTASRVLLVDDEPKVLTALRRSLRGCGFDLSCASSGVEGLALLQREPFDAVISDMRMPGMSGAEFLRASIGPAPDAVRVLLTGYADVDSMAKAVNDGEIFRYVIKPWDDALLLQGLRDGLARRSLVRERDALRAIAERRAEELWRLNAWLEERVTRRTAELAAALEDQRSLATRQKADFSDTVRLLSSLIGHRAGLTAGCPLKVARHVRALGVSCGLLGETLYDLSFAALLQDIGKLSLPEAVVLQPQEALERADRCRLLRHPQVGESSLMALPSLQGAAAILGHVNENFDGSGVPGKVRSGDIPMASRVLRVVADYEHYLAGAIDLQPLAPELALRRLRQHRGTRYDPQVVDGFLRTMDPSLVGPMREVLPVDEGRAVRVEAA